MAVKILRDGADISTMPIEYAEKQTPKYNKQNCEALGITEIPQGFAVHHIDHNPLNNNINNLALIQMGGHSRLHQIEKKMMIPCKVQRLSDIGVGESPNA